MLKDSALRLTLNVLSERALRKCSESALMLTLNVPSEIGLWKCFAALSDRALRKWSSKVLSESTLRLTLKVLSERAHCAL